MSKPYKLSTVLFGHSKDVRSVISTPDDAIISGSRDKTAKYWRPNGINSGYSEAITFLDQKNFVSCVLYVSPSTDYPEGLVLTGGNDKTILVYKPNEPFATAKVTEHEDTVCFLSNALEGNKFLSASWDKTAKFWSLNNLKSPIVTFTGHAAALWSVIQISNGNVVTASADKTVAIWQANGTLCKALHSHTDCVRGLADLPDLKQFVSCANDALIKIWSYEGSELNTLHGHNNYIYCIARNKALGSNCFVTGDESNTIRCWKDNVNFDTIKLPARSVWSVACLSNGDIVSGTSDGLVRIFSQDTARQASEDLLKQYAEELNAVEKQDAQEIGGYKVSDLPGREALYDPGRTAGQIKMIREPEGVVAYSWLEDGDNSRWEKIGDVMGAKTMEGKTLYEGDYYDFVFSVDVEDGKPPLKLPYNKGADVYEAATQFIRKNNLFPDYLDQIVDFIRTNSQDQDLQPSTEGGFVDPFTGAARYVPGSSATNLTTASETALNASGVVSNAGIHLEQRNGNLDPLTGAHSYTTSSKSASAGQYFPHLTYLRFDSGDPKVILGKLREFNERANRKVADSVLENVVELCTAKPCNEETVSEFAELLDWPEEIIFPVVDVLRLLVRCEANCKHLLLKNSEKLVNVIKLCLNPSIPNNTLLAFRALSNICLHNVGEEFILTNRADLLEGTASVTPSNKNIEVGIATFLLNLTILGLKRRDEMLLGSLERLLPDATINCKDPEAHFRLLVALGNLITGYESALLAKFKLCLRTNDAFLRKLEEFIDVPSSPSSNLECKRQSCAQQLKSFI